MKSSKWLLFLLAVIALPLLVNAQEPEKQTALVVPANEWKAKQLTSLGEELRRLEERYNANIFYKSAEVHGKRVSQREVKEKSLEKYLKQLLAPLDMNYRKLTSNSFVVFEKGAKPLQQETVQGTVTDAQSGEPLPGVNILVKGTTTGTSTNAEGQYSLTVPSLSDTLVFSFIGYQKQEVPINGRSEVNVSLKLQAISGAEVVVTALGIEREKLSVGFASQGVEAQELTDVPQPNAIASLTGKVAGLQITNSPNLFSDPGISLRGKDPLIVVDGVPIMSDSWNLNEEDIKSIDVLKGPTASALYGSRGRNGAIQITTKKGSAGNQGLSIEVNSSTQFQTGFYAVPEVQHQYGPGSYGRYSFGDGPFGLDGINSTDYNIWGPKFEGQLIKQWNSPVNPATGVREPTPWTAKGKNNLENFLEMGLLTKNSIAVASSQENSNIRFSVSDKYQKGLVPNTGVNVLNFNLAGQIDFSDRFSADANINYSKQSANNYPNVSYGPWSPIYNILIWQGSNYDIRNLRNYWYPGKEGIQQRYVEYTQYNNPYFVANEQTRGYYKDDVYGYGRLEYTINPNLKIHLRSAISYYYTRRQNRYPISTMSYQPWYQVGGYEETMQNEFETNTDLLVSYNRQLTKNIGMKTNLGANLRSWESKYLYGRTEGGLNVPGIYSLNNSVVPYSPNSSKEYKQVLSGYGSFNFNYSDYLYLALTGRVDKSSALPLSHNIYFYPSASISAVISNMVEIPKPISLLKIRGSYARVGDDLGLYSYSAKYSQGDRWGNQTPLHYSGTLYNPANIDPPFSTSYEGGIELGLFADRLTLDVTHYRTIDGPQVFSLPVSEASGYDARQVSGRKYERRGWEVVLGADIVRSQSFSWNTSINWSILREYLKEVYANEGSLERTEVGDRTDTYYGTVFERSPNGEVVYNNNTGYPQEDPYPQLLGYIRPDWSAGFTSTMNYRNFNFSFSLDGRLGGNIFNEIEYNLWRSGRHVDSTTPEREDEAVRGEKTMVGDGVIVTDGEIVYDGEGNIIKDTREFASNTTATFYSDWARSYWPMDENMVMDRTYFKLREVVLGYTLPTGFLNLPFKKAKVSLIGRNLLYFSKYRSVDLDQFSDSDSGSSLQTPSVRSFGFSINLNF